LSILESNQGLSTKSSLIDETLTASQHTTLSGDDFEYNIIADFRNVTPQDRNIAFYIAWPFIYARSLYSSQFTPVIRYLIAFLLTVGRDLDFVRKYRFFLI